MQAVEEDPVAREAKLKRIFSQVDQDNSGFVDHAELKVLLAKLNLRVDAGSVAFMLSRYDDDNNKKLNFEEFRYCLLIIDHYYNKLIILFLHIF